jgi:hypothetical protein
MSAEFSNYDHAKLPSVYTIRDAPELFARRLELVEQGMHPFDVRVAQQDSRLLRIEFTRLR